MQLETFRDKLFILQEQKAFTNDEIKFLNMFTTIEEIYKIIVSGANDVENFIVDEINVDIISTNKTQIENIWLKVLNTKIN